MCDCGARTLAGCVCPNRYPDEYYGTACNGALCTWCDSSFPCKCGHKSAADKIQSHEKSVLALFESTALQYLKDIETKESVEQEVKAKIQAFKGRGYAFIVQTFPYFHQIKSWIRDTISELQTNE